MSKVWSVVYGMMKSLKSIIYIKGENSKFILANDAFKNNLGLNLTYKVSNKNDSDFFTIKEARKNYAEDYEVLTTGKDISGKIDFIPGTRKKRIGLIFKHPIYNHKGEISGIICSYDDITEIKTLQKDKSLLVKAYKSISDIVSITEAETGKLMFVSDSAEKHTGHSHKVYSNSISILNIMHPEDRAKELEYRKKGITPESRQFRIIHKNGSIVWFETKHYDIIHDNKKYICNIARNITEKKTAETKLSEYKELIAEKLKAKGLSLEEINEIIYQKDNMENKINHLPKSEVLKAIEKRKPFRIPLVNAKWWGEGLIEQHGNQLKKFDTYPEDVFWLMINNPVDLSQMNLSWKWEENSARDTNRIIDDWSKLNEFLEKLPTPEKDPEFLKDMEGKTKISKNDGRYVLFGWWYFFFEKSWMLLGMENLFCDFIEEKENLHRLFNGLCKTYCSYIETANKICNPDGFWVSDDLGCQKGPMISPKTFHEMLFPYYSKVGKTLLDNNIHFWLHSCGDNSLLLPDLINAGVKVFHPVQKYTMCEKSTVDKFRKDITFLAGFDVQHTIQEATLEEVKKEVRFLIDTFDQENGGMMIAAGNGIVSGTPIENIEAFLDESLKYGIEHRNKFK